MEQQMRTRLHELEEQLELGERRLRELEGDATQLRCALLRIAGAAVILRELLGAEPAGRSGVESHERPSGSSATGAAGGRPSATHAREGHDHRDGPWLGTGLRPGQPAGEPASRTSHDAVVADTLRTGASDVVALGDGATKEISLDATTPVSSMSSVMSP